MIRRIEMIAPAAEKAKTMIYKKAVKAIKPILLIIDMQPRYDASSNPELLNSIEYQIKIAKKCKYKIIVVELHHYFKGKLHRLYTTRPRLLKKVKNYSQYQLVNKTGADGSSEILVACEKRRWKPKKFIVTGIHSRFCVAATVRGLLETCNAKIEIIENACRDYGITKGPDPSGTWDMFQRKTRIKIRSGVE